MSIRSGEATYGGYRTRVLEVHGTGPKLVLLHGYADSADTWRGVLAACATQGRAAVAVDLPGFGQAAPLVAGPMLPQLDAFVDDLVRDQAVSGPVVLVGNSLGGCTTVRAATRALPLQGAITIGDPAAGRWWPASVIASRSGGLLLQVLASAVPMPVFRIFARRGLRRIAYGNPSAADPRVIAAFIDWMTAQGGPRGVAAQTRGLAAEIFGEHARNEPIVPLLIVHGARDRIVPVRGSRQLHAAVPASRLVVEPRWGHCPQLDDPVELTRLVTGFSEERPWDAGLQATP